MKVIVNSQGHMQTVDSEEVKVPSREELLRLRKEVLSFIEGTVRFHRDSWAEPGLAKTPLIWRYPVPDKLLDLGMTLVHAKIYDGHTHQYVVTAAAPAEDVAHIYDLEAWLIAAPTVQNGDEFDSTLYEESES